MLHIHSIRLVRPKFCRHNQVCLCTRDGFNALLQPTFCILCRTLLLNIIMYMYNLLRKVLYHLYILYIVLVFCCHFHVFVMFKLEIHNCRSPEVTERTWLPVKAWCLIVRCLLMATKSVVFVSTYYSIHIYMMKNGSRRQPLLNAFLLIQGFY
jgi:hypothetical protein